MPAYDSSTGRVLYDPDATGAVGPGYYDPVLNSFIFKTAPQRQVMDAESGMMVWIGGERSQGFTDWEDSLSASTHLTWGNAWAIGKARSEFGPGWAAPDINGVASGLGTPKNNYDWIILGEYATPPLGSGPRRPYIFDNLRTIGSGAGLPSDFDWTNCIAYGSAIHWAQSGQPFRFLETPAILPIYYAVECASKDYPSLKPVLEQIGPGSEIWEQSAVEARARRDAHKEITRSLTTIAVLAVATFGAAAYLAPAAGATTGTTVTATTAAEEAAMLGIAETGGTTAAITGTAGETALFDTLATGWEGAIAESAVQNAALAEVTGGITAGTLASAIGDEAAALALNAAKSAVVSELQNMLSDELAAGSPLASTPKKADIGPLLALGLVAGAFIVRKMRE